MAPSEKSTAEVPASASSASPFHCDELGVVARIVLDADKVRATAAAWLRKLADAEAAVATAESQFTASLTDSDAQQLATAHERVRNLKSIANAIEDAGGTSGAFDRAVRSKQTFTLLAKAFELRVVALDKLLIRKRDAVARRLADLTVAGASFSETRSDAEFIRLHSDLNSVQTARQSSLEDANYCRQWEPNDFERKFSDLHEHACRALPTV